MYKALQKQPEGHFDECNTATYVGQLADALNYCHSKKVRELFLRKVMKIIVLVLVIRQSKDKN